MFVTILTVHRHKSVKLDRAQRRQKVDVHRRAPGGDVHPNAAAAQRLQRGDGGGGHTVVPERQQRAVNIKKSGADGWHKAPPVRDGE